MNSRTSIEGTRGIGGNGVVSDILSKARSWLLWPWRLMLVAAFAVSLIGAVQQLVSPAAREEPAVLLTAVGLFVSLGFSALLVVRGYRNRSALLLAVIMLTLGSAGLTNLVMNAPGLPNAPSLLLLTIGLLQISLQMSFAYILPIFSLEIAGGPYSRRQARLVHGLAAVLAVVLGAYLFAMSVLQLPAFIREFSIFLFWYALANQFFSFAVIGVNYARNDIANRNRIKIVLVAFALNTVTSLQDTLGFVVVSETWTTSAMVVLRFIMLALLAYAVLKQRLVDIDFAVNRTLVYGSVTFSLLLTFGLLEWSVEHLVPEAWHEGGPYISAAIAVGLFLVFHRLREWFEHHVERLFFSSWQRAEADLKRFVESAGHFDRMKVLCGSFTEALSRFAGGAEAALYLRDAEGTYRAESGKLFGIVPEMKDDPAFALMRAERQPLDLTRVDGNLPGTLALPMLDQGNLVGFALVGSKADGAHYRPDEVENLGWAAHQVGLDFQALQARELRARVASLSGDLALSEKDNARLSALLAGLLPQPAKG